MSITRLKMWITSQKMHIWGELSTIYLQTTHFIHINSVKIFTYDRSDFALNVFVKVSDLNIT